MDEETTQRLKECEEMISCLEQSSSKHIIQQVQSILSKNVEIISEIRSAKEQSKSDPSSKDCKARVAVLLQQLNYNINEVVSLYQDVKSNS